MSEGPAVRAPVKPAKGSLRDAFRAFRHRNFQLFWAGQGISVIGTWMQMTAQSWLIYRLTHSPLVLGLLTVARFGPSLVIAPMAGHWADLWPRRRLVILTQGASLVLATVLAWLALSGAIRVGHILALAFLQGSVDSMDMTVRQTFQMDLVGPEDLQSAVSLNSAAFNSARMVGPFLAGILIARLGEGLCFALNAASYVAVLATLIMIRVAPAAQPPPGRDSMVDAIAAGMRYAWRTVAVRRVMLAIAMTTSIGLAANTLTPALARDILGTGSQGYGRLLAGAGVGAILGALVSAGASTARYAHVVNFLTLCGLGLSLLGLGAARGLPLATACMMVIGFMSSIQFSTSNAYLQTTAPPGLRGRVVSMYVWIFQGLTPMGGFAAGWLASRIGIPPTIQAAGAVCLLSGLGLGAFRSPSGAGPLRRPTGA
jgi:MFS family permease